MNLPRLSRKLLLEELTCSPSDARVALIGVPMDSTSSYRPGSRFAPGEVRNIFQVLEDYSMVQDRHFSETKLYDLGDVVLPRGNVEKELKTSEEVIRLEVEKDKIPLVLGGEHTVTLAAVKPLLEKYPDLAVIHIDAHADMRASYLGENYSHASVIYALLQLGVKQVYQLGIRSGTEEEISLARSRTYFYPHQVRKPLEKIVPVLAGRPVYVTLDIDVVDPAFAPGTGSPEPGGISSEQLLLSMSLLSNLNLVGFDLVEVSPPYDTGGVTSLLAAKILREVAFLLDTSH